MEGLWKGLMGGELMKPTQLQWGKHELLGSRAENDLDVCVLYKLVIGLSLDAVDRMVEFIRISDQSPKTQSQP